MVKGEFERVLRRVAHGARLLGLLWWATLSLLVTAEGRIDPGRRWIPVTTALVGLAWAAAASLLYRRDPFSATSRPVIVVDVALAVAAVLAPTAAYGGNPDVLFYGGFPFIVVVVASIRGLRSGWVVATILSATVLVQLFDPAGDYAFTVSQVMVYVAGAFIATWTMNVLRRSDAEIRTARDALARAQERAEISEHLHDSVLQTLALIQRSSGRSADVVGLARRQERELRDWLYGDPSAPDGAAGLSDAIRAAAAEVEDSYGVPVDVVTVGDAGAGPAIEALTAAAREAMVNAARHSGADSVSVYVEAGADGSRVFVRDRGVGFDRRHIEADRQGIVGSIEGRLSRVGGEAALRSAPGKGTEWRLEVADG